ncbi:hypothetical protein MGN70_005789 [Eutypa lata]|nr:hypothetical protein MGN70_005789 [Eutypa lata]
MAALAGFVAADSCNSGGVYCGYSLIAKGDYRDDIVTELSASGYSTDETSIQQSLFNCLDNGQIDVTSYCANGCVGGDSSDDYCS